MKTKIITLMIALILVTTSLMSAETLDSQKEAILIEEYPNLDLEEVSIIQTKEKIVSLNEGFNRYSFKIDHTNLTFEVTNYKVVPMTRDEVLIKLANRKSSLEYTLVEENGLVKICIEENSCATQQKRVLKTDSEIINSIENKRNNIMIVEANRLQKVSEKERTGTEMTRDYSMTIDTKRGILDWIGDLF